jgi:hypothetical protein
MRRGGLVRDRHCVLSRLTAAGRGEWWMRELCWRRRGLAAAVWIAARTPTGPLDLPEGNEEQDQLQEERHEHLLCGNLDWPATRVEGFAAGRPKRRSDFGNATRPTGVGV